MLASIDWLKKYVDINVTPEELAEKMGVMDVYIAIE